MTPQSLALIALFSSLIAMASAPEWMHDTMVRSGSILTLVCSGSGPSMDLARRSALDSCRQTAADAKNSNQTIHSVSIETEHSVAYHSETSSRVSVKNLDCDVLQELSESSGDGGFTDYIKCRYDLSKAKVETINERNPGPSQDAGSGGLVNGKDSASVIPTSNTEVTAGTVIQGENRHLILTSIPNCDEVLVRGQRPRVIKCDESPKTLFIYAGDHELIVRAVGFLPRHIELNRSRSTASTTETLEVHLERL